MPGRPAYRNAYLDNQGRPISGASVRVRQIDTSTDITETIYSDATGAATLTQPLSTGSDGSFQFYIAEADFTAGEHTFSFDIFITATGYDDITIEDQFATRTVGTVATHATTHQPSGSDTMAVDAAVGTGSLRTLGTGAAQGFPGDYHAFARKTADESVTSSTTAQDDDHLFFAVAANEVWFFECFLVVNGPTAGDIKVGFTVPTGATLLRGIMGLDVAVTSPSGDIRVSASTTSGSLSARNTAGVGTRTTIWIAGTVVNGGTAGNLQLQWAQQVSDGSATTVEVNSWLMGHRVS